MRIRRRSSVILTIACVALAWAATAGADVPTPGVQIQCTFVGGVTTCITTTITVDGPACFDDDATISLYGSPIVRYDVTEVVSVVEYAGKVVTGDPVTSSTGQVYYTSVRRHAKVVAESGPFASGERLTLLVDSCPGD